MRILGVDPGLTGGAAVWKADGDERGSPGVVSMIDIPVIGEKAKRRVDVMQFRDWIKASGPVDHAFIERAQAMPDQGASSGFIYGRAVGALEAVIGCLNIPMTVIEATSWKKFHNLIRTDKEASRQRALQLAPSAVNYLARKMDHGRAEALLMALYGVRLL